MNDTHDYVHPTAITAWQLIGAVTGVFVIMVIAAWTIITNEAANNKAITDDLKLNYVTKSNHEDLVNRFVREVSRVDELARDSLPRNEYNAWRLEHEKAIKAMQAELKTLHNDTVTHREFDGVVNERGEQIKALRAEATDRLKTFATKEELQAHSTTDTERVQSLRREVDALRYDLNIPPKQQPLR